MISQADRKEFDNVQYLAVSPMPHIDYKPAMGTKQPASTPGCIQIWAAQSPVIDVRGNISEAGGMNCELVLCIKGGPALEVKWMPMGAWDAVSAAITICLRNHAQVSCSRATALGSRSLAFWPPARWTAPFRSTRSRTLVLCADTAIGALGAKALFSVSAQESPRSILTGFSRGRIRTPEARPAGCKLYNYGVDQWQPHHLRYI